MFVFKLIFTSAGWLLVHEIYRVFNPSVSTETNIEELSNFVLSDQNSLGGAGIGIGYVGCEHYYSSIDPLCPGHRLISVLAWSGPAG